MTTSARSANTDGLATRERILAEAAILFAKRGFHGTSTRDIAGAVGVRQPSLFHHFPTKQDVLAELLDRDLGPALRLIRRVRQLKATVPVRLYLYLHTDVSTLIDFPFDARGIYNDDVLEGEGFSEQRERREVFHSEIRNLIAEGVRTGELRDVDPAFAQKVISALTLDTISDLGSGSVVDPEGRPGDIADFVLLGLLKGAADLGHIRSEASRLKAAEGF